MKEKKRTSIKRNGNRFLYGKLRKCLRICFFRHNSLYLSVSFLFSSHTLWHFLHMFNGRLFEKNLFFHFFPHSLTAYLKKRKRFQNATSSYPTSYCDFQRCVCVCVYPLLTSIHPNRGFFGIDLSLYLV